MEFEDPLPCSQTPSVFPKDKRGITKVNRSFLFYPQVVVVVVVVEVAAVRVAKRVWVSS
jgi:hypothetical protein